MEQRNSNKRAMETSPIIRIPKWELILAQCCPSVLNSNFHTMLHAFTVVCIAGGFTLHGHHRDPVPNTYTLPAIGLPPKHAKTCSHFSTILSISMLHDLKSRGKW